MAEIYNRTLGVTKAAMLLIPQSARVLARNTHEDPTVFVFVALHSKTAFHFAAFVIMCCPRQSNEVSELD